MKFRQHFRIPRLASLALVAAGWAVAAEMVAAPSVSEGVALAIVFDTSGSMRDAVADAGGGKAPKHEIGRRALRAVVDRLEAFASSGPRVEAGLVIFRNARAEEAVAFGPFDARPFRQWADGFRQPEGATPLGSAVELGARKTLASGLPHRHVLVITDGVNTAGPKPEFVLPRLAETARTQEQTLAFHFVAFDVAAKEFQAVRELGATVVGAVDEAELNAQLNFIIERKILLEDEE